MSAGTWKPSPGGRGTYLRTLPDGTTLAASPNGWSAWGPDAAGGEVGGCVMWHSTATAAMEAADLWAVANGYPPVRAEVDQ